MSSQPATALPTGLAEKSKRWLAPGVGVIGVPAPTGIDPSPPLPVPPPVLPPPEPPPVLPPPDPPVLPPVELVGASRTRVADQALRTPPGPAARKAIWTSPSPTSTVVS
ncbi:MAG: hypothetical protein R3F16_09400 [Myxococcota bacterium]